MVEALSWFVAASASGTGNAVKIEVIMSTEEYSQIFKQCNTIWKATNWQQLNSSAPQ